MESAARAKQIKSLAAEIYGCGPTVAARISTLSHDQQPGFGGAATVRNLLLRTEVGDSSHVAQMSIVHPAGHERVPLFVGLNFRGNHTIATDAAIALPEDSAAPLAYDEYTANPQPRGSLAGRWSLAAILERGFGLATVCYLQLGPDSAALREQGLLPMLRPRDAEGWGGLGLWAWYLQRMLDVLLDQDLGSRHIAFGHSRLGKAALWAAAQDVRFDGVIANNSGCMGASLSLSDGAETPALLAEVRPYWFAAEFERRVRGGVPLPTQDRMLAAIAPRPVYVASAEDDRGADPDGERLAVEAARRANPDAPLGYHCRPGGHDVTAGDWEHFLDYFDSPISTPRAERSAVA